MGAEIDFCAMAWILLGCDSTNKNTRLCSVYAVRCVWCIRFTGADKSNNKWNDLLAVGRTREQNSLAWTNMNAVAVVRFNELVCTTKYNVDVTQIYQFTWSLGFTAWLPIHTTARAYTHTHTPARAHAMPIPIRFAFQYKCNVVKFSVKCVVYVQYEYETRFSYAQSALSNFKNENWDKRARESEREGEKERLPISIRVCKYILCFYSRAECCEDQFIFIICVSVGFCIFCFFLRGFDIFLLCAITIIIN